MSLRPYQLVSGSYTVRDGVYPASVGEVDTFEHNDLSKYDVRKSGDRNAFDIQTGTVAKGNYALQVKQGELGYNQIFCKPGEFQNAPLQPGDAFRWYAYLDTPDATNICIADVLFGVQNQDIKNNGGYAARFRTRDGNYTIDVTKSDSDGNSSTLCSVSGSFTLQDWVWMDVSWNTTTGPATSSDEIAIEAFDADGTSLGTDAAVDTQWQDGDTGYKNAYDIDAPAFVDHVGLL